MAATGAPIRVPVAVACRVLGLSTQGYYKWLKNPISQRDYHDAHLINAALDIHADDPGYGVPVKKSSSFMVISTSCPECDSRLQVSPVRTVGTAPFQRSSR